MSHMHSAQSSISSVSSVSAPLLGRHHKQELDDIAEYDFTPRSTQMSRTRHPAITLLSIVTCMTLLTAALTVFWIKGESFITVGPSPSDIHPTPDVATKTGEFALAPEDPWKAKLSEWVKGEPTNNFQDNLRDDMQYVTTWVGGGWTNDVMTYINMIYLGLLTSRTPILPPFAPTHVALDGGFPPFGDVFDVPRLSASINSPLLEWRDVKRENSSETDQLGCWSIWSLVGDGKPRPTMIPRVLKLDVAYTSLPKSTPIMPVGQYWVPFWALAQLGFKGRRTQALAEHPPQTPAQSGIQLPPDEQLMCFDFMYFIGAAQHDEWWQEWSPAWRFVGRYTRWNPDLEQLAREYINRALGLDSDGEGFALYIGVHIRRGDFTAACGNIAKDECFQPLAAYARRVNEIRARLLTEKGVTIPPHHVLVTSDEKDPEWWDEVGALGWHWADHTKERTEEIYGKWYPSLIDAVVQSMGVGFVGTDRSTMSLVARRRVEDWHGGIGHLVRIGSKDADAH